MNQISEDTSENLSILFTRYLSMWLWFLILRILFVIVDHCLAYADDFLKWLRLGSSAFVWLDAKFFILYYIEGFFIFFFENIWKLRDKKGTAQFEIPRFSNFEYLSKWKLLTYFISWSTITSEIPRVGPFPKCNFREVWF